MPLWLEGQVEPMPQAADQKLLASLEQAGVKWRVACDNGVCGICACVLQQGQIDYRQQQPRGLDTDEIRAGVILPCIAYPASPELRISRALYP